MGSYGIGSGRLLACIAEEHHDENGLIWPITVAPYEVEIVQLKGGDEKAAEVYQQLIDAGVEVLMDDRSESPGVKFNDADLLGIPIRLTIGKRSLDKGVIELKLRRDSERIEVPAAEIIQKVVNVKAELIAEIKAKVEEVPFKEE
jgi:prolyl-tRNA synthetase